MTNDQSPSPPITIDWEKYRHLIKERTVPAKTVLLNEGDLSK